MPETWNPFSSDFWTEENWFGSQGQKPWRISPISRRYEMGVPGENMRRLLEQQARGEGPSLGRGMMQEGLQQTIKNQRSQAASMMGTNPALAQKLSGEQAAGMTQDVMRDVGQVGLQEQMQAQQALQAWLQQERLAQMALERDRMMQESQYQARLMGWDPATQGIFSDVAGMVGSGLGMGAAAGWFGQGLQNAFGGGGRGAGRSRGISPDDPIWGY